MIPAAGTRRQPPNAWALRRRPRTAPGRRAAGAAAAGAWTGIDTFGVPWFVVFAAYQTVSADRRLCATLFLFALAIELYGTGLHGWRYYTVEPWFGLTTTNPPVWIGAVYCTLETLVRFVARRRESSQVIASKPLAGSPASALL